MKHKHRQLMADGQHVHTEKCIWDSLCYWMFQYGSL